MTQAAILAASGSPGTTTGFKNRIINGAMVIDQRNAGASTTPSSTGVTVYTLDRWAAVLSQASKYSVQQNAGSITPPVGFTNYLGVTSLAATSLGNTDYFFLQQRIEGYNMADLNWGSANAKTITLSAWVYSSLTGTFGGALLNGSEARSYPFTYTISSANTWTQISVTVAGDTTGTWLTTNGTGMEVIFSLGMGASYSGTANTWQATFKGSATGATSVVGTNGATWYITGCQLEVGTTATNFDFRSYGTELQLCSRYATWLPVSIRGYGTTGAPMFYAMRATPTFASPVVDPDAASSISSNVTSINYFAGYSGKNGGYLQLGGTTSADAYYLGYRSLATAEL